MKRSDMVCEKCIKYDAAQHECHLNPLPVIIWDVHEKTGYLDAATHWCAQGVWHQWSELYQANEPFHWGEWEK